jgi:sugar-specific transcriptional regulator TrmB
MLNISQFGELGIEPRQAKVYLAVLELGPATIAQIAKKSGIKRTTIYEFIHDMVDKGLLNTSSIGKRTLYVAISPDELDHLVERQKEIISQMKPELQLLLSKAPQKPKVRYYEGVVGVKKVYEEMLHAKNKDIYWFGTVKDIMDSLGKEYLNSWVNRRIKKGYISHTIRIRDKEANNEFSATGKKVGRNVRFFPVIVKESFSQIFIVDQKIMIVSTQAEGYCLVIESAELAQTIKYFWQVIWGVSKTK